MEKRSGIGGDVYQQTYDGDVSFVSDLEGTAAPQTQRDIECRGVSQTEDKV